jgi:Restriction endonuclease
MCQTQCKHQREPVGTPDLQKLLGVISADPPYTGGVHVMSARFSGDAHEFASRNGRLQLIDKNTLALLLVQLRIPLREVTADLSSCKLKCWEIIARIYAVAQAMVLLEKNITGMR